MISITRDDDGALSFQPTPVSLNEKPVIIMVNGFNYDPTETGKDNPHLSLFPRWASRLQDIPSVAAGETELVGFGWYSAELEAPSWFRAWAAGRRNPYRWAWDIALAAGDTLAEVIGWERKAPVHIIAHSLGARVVLAALRRLPPRTVSNVLLLNGAEYSQRARVTAEYTRAQVLNIVVESDRILGIFGRTFAPEQVFGNVVGRDGIIQPPSSWIDLSLDADYVRSKIGADLQGGGEDGSHWRSYECDANWRLFNSFLNGGTTLAAIRRWLDED